MIKRSSPEGSNRQGFEDGITGKQPIIRLTDKVTNRVTGEGTDKVTDREKQVLQLLIEDPGYTMPQLAQKMTVSRKTVAGYLKSLKEKGILERVGTTRSGDWEVIG